MNYGNGAVPQAQPTMFQPPMPPQPLPPPQPIIDLVDPRKPVDVQVQNDLFLNHQLSHCLDWNSSLSASETSKKLT
jgi:hypothetical protein